MIPSPVISMALKTLHHIFELSMQTTLIFYLIANTLVTFGTLFRLQAGQRLVAETALFLKFQM
jgi:hypothetical protein